MFLRKMVGFLERCSRPGRQVCAPVPVPTLQRSAQAGSRLQLLSVSLLCLFVAALLLLLRR